MIIGSLAAVIAVLSGVIIWKIREEHKMMDRLNEMVQTAIEGKFEERVYDETKLSALEARLSRFLAKASYSEKTLQAEQDKIKTLIADIAHQTKTPVANLLLYGELLKEAEAASDHPELIVHMNQQTEKLKFLIEALMKSSRLENGIIKVVPAENEAGQLIQNVYDDTRQKAGKKGIEYAIENNSITAIFDFKWTKEALFNIVDNAIKYTPKGGKVKIWMEEYERFCRINISDNGIGMREEETSRIFRRFYRSPKASSQEGVGIGLFLAREIITRQNGYIKVSSSEGEGSVFSVFIPKFIFS